MQMFRQWLGHTGAKRRFDDFLFNLRRSWRKDLFGLTFCFFSGLLGAHIHSLISPPPSCPSAPLEISPLFKMFGGGMQNGGVAQFLGSWAGPDFTRILQRSGSQKVIIDIGVYDGGEAALAVKRGYTVFAFEPVNEHIHLILDHFANQTLSDRIKFVNLTAMFLDEFGGDFNKMQRSLTKQRMLKEYPLIEVSPGKSKGFCYLFQAGASDVYNKTVVQGAGVWTELSGTTAPRSQRHPSWSTVITVPVSDFIHHDVFWFKADVQGRELSVLRGAVNLFQRHRVQAMTIEYSPKFITNLYGENGIKNLLELIEQELRLRVCFPSMTDELRLLFDRSVNITEFIKLSREVEDLGRGRTYFFDDLTCF